MEQERNDEAEVEYLHKEFVPDDPDETREREAAAFRKTEKAAVIRELKGRGYNRAQIKIYAPALLRKRERDGIRAIEEAQRPGRRILGKPIGKRDSRRAGRRR